jgi:hypothetical protein
MRSIAITLLLTFVINPSVVIINISHFYQFLWSYRTNIRIKFCRRVCEVLYIKKNTATTGNCYLRLGETNDLNPWWNLENLLLWNLKSKWCVATSKKSWKIQKGNQKPQIKEQTIKWPKEKGQYDKQWPTKHYIEN